MRMMGCRGREGVNRIKGEEEQKERWRADTWEAKKRVSDRERGREIQSACRRDMA